MEKIQITTEYIKLDQLMKWANIVSSGADAKHVITDGKVLVNGEVELRRGKKMRIGDILEFDGKKVEVIAG
ncbi:MAG: S4 domain-containing protein YaaA [Psychrilyobacter sp.]|nr:S4 domain-containing protein YaaA [Psychrilyobacter sp.]